MSIAVTLVCNDGIEVSCDAQHYKTISDLVAELDDKQVCRVPMPYDAEIVRVATSDKLASYKHSSEQDVAQVLEVLHYLQASSEVVGRWTSFLPRRWWEVLPHHILHMLYTTDAIFTQVNWQIESVVSDTLAVISTSGELSSYHAAMAVKWQETNTVQHCGNHLPKSDKSSKHGWSSPCSHHGTCHSIMFSVVKYFDGLDTRYAGLNILTHSYDEWLAADKDILPVLHGAIIYLGVIDKQAAIRILTRVCEVTCKTGDPQLLDMLRDCRLGYEHYDMASVPVEPISHLLDYCAEKFMSELTTAGLMKRGAEHESELSTLMRSLVVRGELLSNRHCGHPAIVAAEEVIGSKAMDFVFCYRYINRVA